MGETLGERVRRMREARGWSQEQLGMRAGLTRGHIATMEHRKAKSTGIPALRRLAEAFGVIVGELSEDAGQLTDEPGEKRQETVEDILERLKLVQPASVPVYSRFPANTGRVRETPTEYVYKPRESAKPSIEAYRVNSDYLEPEVRNGDVVIVDRALTPEIGDIMLCSAAENLVVGHLRDDDGNRFLENNHLRVNLADCGVAAVVIEVYRRVRGEASGKSE